MSNRWNPHVKHPCFSCRGWGFYSVSKDPDIDARCLDCRDGIRDEQWRPVPGFEGQYDVSDFGQVRNARTRKVRALITKPSGHQSVSLYSDNRESRLYVHRMVLEAFVGPCPPGQEGCHNDGEATHNDITNLRWDTRLANAADTRAHGTHSNTQKERCPVGHRLESPNLSEATLRKGKRMCLACASARTTYRRHGGDLKEISDHHYARIMRDEEIR